MKALPNFSVLFEYQIMQISHYFYKYFYGLKVSIQVKIGFIYSFVLFSYFRKVQVPLLVNKTKYLLNYILTKENKMLISEFSMGKSCSGMFVSQIFTFDSCMSTIFFLSFVENVSF